MQILEAIFLVITLVFLVQISFSLGSRKLGLRLFQISLAIGLLHVMLEVVRWQMAFAYVIFFLLALLLLKKSTWYPVFRMALVA